MGYMHIENLNKNDEVLMFKKVWATEKVHGTSAHVAWDPEHKEIKYFSGGASHEEFSKLFDDEFVERFKKFVSERGEGDTDVVVYGEAYGGKMQGMSATYGKKLRFIVFEVRIGNNWLSFDQVVLIARELQLDCVPGEVIDCTEEELRRVRGLPSEVAVMCGCGDNTDRYGNKPPLREGIVIRPLIELRKNNGGRIIAKFKNADFSERNSRRDADYPSEKVRERLASQEAAKEWVTTARLEHVMDAIHLTDPKIQDIKTLIPAMVEDVLREAKDEVVDSSAFRRAVGGITINLFKKRLGIMS